MAHFLYLIDIESHAEMFQLLFKKNLSKDWFARVVTYHEGIRQLCLLQTSIYLV